jgi:hypothetical protein
MGYKIILVIICLGEKEISPKELKITPRVLMITFGVIDVGEKLC